MEPSGLVAIAPSVVAVGEPFSVRVKVLGAVRPIPCRGQFNTFKPRLEGPFNRNVERRIHYLDHVLPEYAGTIRVEGNNGGEGPARLTFDGRDQGVFPGDPRPIRAFGPFRMWKAGVHFLRLVEESSGVVGLVNPIVALPAPPDERLYWGDPHWQTFFSDGIRCPEELYAFARDEAFLDFGAIADHMEAITERQWDYFRAVTEDSYQPGRFVTLHGQEWTHHDPARGAPGHRNLYFRGREAPLIRSTDGDANTLEKLWRKLDAIGLPALAIPHHTANRIMGVDWSLGWNPRYEKGVEIYSVWGSSECSVEAGNTRPIRTLGGEMPGRHVRDALARGYRLGFWGGGDIHDGRPGDELHTAQPEVPAYVDLYSQGFTAVWAPALTREMIFDALAARRCYATTRRGLFAEWRDGPEGRLGFRAAAADGVARAELIVNGEKAGEAEPPPDGDNRVLDAEWAVTLGRRDVAYVRLWTQTGEWLWLSPRWGGRGEGG